MKGLVILWCILLLWPFYLYSMTQTQKWQIFSQIFSVCTISNWRVISLKNLSSIASYFLELLGRETSEGNTEEWSLFYSSLVKLCWIVMKYSLWSLNFQPLVSVLCALFFLNNKTEKFILSLPCKAKLLGLISSLQYKIDSKCFKMTSDYAMISNWPTYDILTNFQENKIKSSFLKFFKNFTKSYHRLLAEAQPPPPGGGLGGQRGYTTKNQVLCKFWGF